jgi:Zn-dependent peptidase ImmA (M78 family)
MSAKQVLFDYKILGSPVAAIPKVLQGENIELVDVSVDDDSCGMYCIEENRRKIYVNRNMSEGRRNFTIAHELGHHFLSHRLNEYCRIYRNLNTVTHKKDPQEIEANYFAACFLMPYELIMPLFNEVVSAQGLHKDSALNLSDNKQLSVSKEVIRQVASRMKVSQEAAFYRLKGLQLLRSQNDFSELNF